MVKEGDVLKIEKLEVEPGQEVTFDVLLKADGDKVEIGAPLLAGKVKAEVVEQGKADKISVVKYKPKSRYSRRVGHRQMFTKVKIKSV